MADDIPAVVIRSGPTIAIGYQASNVGPYTVSVGSFFDDSIPETKECCTCCSKSFVYANLLKCIDCKKKICQDCWWYTPNAIHFSWERRTLFCCTSCFSNRCETRLENRNKCCAKFWRNSELDDYKALGSYEFVAEAVSYYEAVKFAEDFDTSKLE